MFTRGGGARAAARLAIAATLALGSVGCTVHHSRHALNPDLKASPPPNSRFVSEDDSGLLLFGIVTLSEPDHYAVLVERARRKHRCGKLSQGQLDFFTEHWLLVGFPVVRVTLLCEPGPDPKPSAGAATTPRASSGDQGPGPG